MILVNIGNVEKLVKKRKTEDEPVLRFIPNEELYFKIQEIHVQQGHGGINKLMVFVKLLQKNLLELDRVWSTVTAKLAGRCKCKRQKVICNSRCHNSLSYRKNWNLSIIVCIKGCDFVTW